MKVPLATQPSAEFALGPPRNVKQYVLPLSERFIFQIWVSLIVHYTTKIDKSIANKF